MDRDNGKMLLVVNDDPVQLRLLRNLLQKDVWKVFPCESAEEVFP